MHNVQMARVKNTRNRCPKNKNISRLREMPLLLGARLIFGHWCVHYDVVHFDFRLELKYFCMNYYEKIMVIFLILHFDICSIL